MKNFFFLFILFPALSFAQISEGGTPLGFLLGAELSEEIPEIIMPPFNLDSLKAQDLVNDKRKDIPWRFGYNFRVNLSLNNSGVWESLGNGDRLWRIKITSQNALSINLIFGEFEIPRGGKVFIYNTSKTHVLGAFTEKNNLPHRQLGVDLVLGNSVIVEYFEPNYSTGKGYLMIEQVTHGYRGVPVSVLGFGNSGPCNNNVVCPEGIPWQDQIRSVAMNLVNGNTWCSGVLVNNTCQDGIPYYLTANHCISGSVANWVFRFNYESPVCSPSQDGPYNLTVSGATLRAKNGLSDFALLELSSAPPAAYNVFYAGWDRSGNTPTSSVGIHHPAGDVKKITFDYDSASPMAWQGSQVWRISNWEDGTTEGGSSGSPLFDQNKRIIGQLYGGSASCSSITDDNYGRFDVSWNAGGSAATQLKDWLDMCNTGQTVLDGYDPNFVFNVYDVAVHSINGIPSFECNMADSVFPFAIIKNLGIDTLSKAKIYYGVNGALDSMNWSGSLATNEYDTVILPMILLQTAGDYIYSVRTALPNDSADQNDLNDTKTFSFKFITDFHQVVFTLNTDDYGSETSWLLKDTSGFLWYYGSGYSDVNGGQAISDTFCLTEGCYDFIINDSYGNGMSGLNGSGTQGSYYLVKNCGDTIAKIINANFGYEEINGFCLPAPLTLNFSVTNSLEGVCDGSALAFSSGGRPPYSFNWDNGDSADAIVNLCPGKYVLTVTDIVGCSIKDSIFIYEIVGQGEIFNEPFSVEIFPNPNSGKFIIRTAEIYHSELNLSFKNILGETIFESSVYSNQPEFEIDLSHLNVGVYFLFISRENASAARKFVVLK